MTVLEISPPGELPASDSRWRAARSAGGLGLGLFLVLVGASGLAVVVGVVVLTVSVSVVIWRHPAWAAVGMLALLPVNRFLSMLVSHFSGSSMVTLGSQLWKDLLLAVLVLRGVDEVVMRRRPALHYLDLLVFTFLAIATLYLIYPGASNELTLLNRVLGFRSSAMFMFAYFIGRVIAFERHHLRWLVWAMVPGTALVAGVAAAQFIWPAWSTELFNRLGYQEFVLGQGTFGEVALVRERGIAGVDLTRAGSLLLGDLALGFYCVFAVAVAGALLFTATRPRQRAGGFALVAAVLATSVFTVTRSAVAACIVVLTTMAILTRRVMTLCAVGAVALTAGLLLVATNVIPIDAVRALANPEEQSTQAHIDAVDRSFDAIEAEPMGRGLGTAGTIGQRFLGSSAITNENWYLQIGTELGVVTGALFLTISVVAGFAAARNARRVGDVDLQRIALVVAGGSAGFFVVANVLHAWEVSVLSMSFWLFAGIALTVPDAEDPLT